MKNSEIKATIESLESITAQIPVKVGFKIAKNLRTLKEALKIYNSEHDRIVKEYAADGEHVRETDNFKAFAADIIELNNLDAGITLEKVRYEDIEDLCLTLQQTTAIMHMTKEEPDGEQKDF